MAKIKKIEPAVATLERRKRVAAYARVSKDTERLLHSVSAQVSYYNKLIQGNPEWEFAGVYADSGLSGTGTQWRDEFQRLLADCEAGKIDIVLTKSISRFARNTLDLLETVLHLKELGVEVRFEKEQSGAFVRITKAGPPFRSSPTDIPLLREYPRSIRTRLRWFD